MKRLLASPHASLSFLCEEFQESQSNTEELIQCFLASIRGAIRTLNVKRIREIMETFTELVVNYDLPNFMDFEKKQELFLHLVYVFSHEKDPNVSKHIRFLEICDLLHMHTCFTEEQKTKEYTIVCDRIQKIQKTIVQKFEWKQVGKLNFYELAYCCMLSEKYPSPKMEIILSYRVNRYYELSMLESRAIHASSHMYRKVVAMMSYHHALSLKFVS